ncbi:hypothetical protein [Flavobacterium gilvum]|uniref:Uncharacterized protein n=1 Tax=Flavobacterium gilvum TaxID=1492737 RepID=A0AAC9I2F5_9FLAO|nr:hypothetical protein [Flavobacterium gilvum]AOW08720.1 hypothetical protein EM308_03960 [Flavobacterium gilvum]KFC59843.1 hypothetical protein FEM08_13540 [Flavobacterium gilvum]
MKSQREVERLYYKLIQDVKTNDFYTKVNLENRVNCYVCDSCGNITKTKDIDAGVTPMFFSCEKCGQRARSTFFNDIVPNKQPTIEWYRPSLHECLKMRSKEAALDHVLNGGLNFRKITHDKN